MMDTIWQDVRFGLRRLRRSPGFALVAVITLALGIGANTAIFSVVRGVLLRPLPYDHPDQLVTVAELSTKGRSMAVAWPNYVDWRTSSSSFSGLAPIAGLATDVVGGRAPVHAHGAAVGQDFWKIFRVTPLQGRLTLSSDHVQGAAPVVVVSRSFWRNELGGKPLDTYDLEIQGAHARVVGVLPDAFHYPTGAEFWFPAELNAWGSDSRSAHNWRVVARLAPGVSLDRAREDLDGLTKRIIAGVSGEDPEFLATGVVMTPLLETIVGGARQSLYLLLAAAGFVLLVACINLAGALLGRGAARNQELAVRAAVGAGVGRIVRQLLIESFLLAGLGAVAGVAMGIVVVRALVAGAPAFLPRLGEIGVDGAVLAYTGGLAVVTALLFGVLPARRLACGNPADALRTGSRGNALDARGGVWRFLVGSEVALALVLLTGSGLLLRSFQTLLGEPPGVDASRVDVVRTSLSQLKYPSGADHARWYRAFLEQVKALPGVTDAGVMSAVPPDGAPNGRLELDGDLDKHEVGEYVVASEGAFKALRIPLLQGRLFDERDGPETEHVAIVSKAFADRAWPGENPIGRSVTGGGMDNFWEDRRFARVVGVVGDVRYDGLDRAAYPTVYFPYSQRPFRLQYSANVVVQSGSNDPAALFGTLRSVLHAADPDVPPRIATMSSMLRDSLGQRQFVMLVVAGFSLTALILACVGIFGVVSHSAARRTREMGIRIALGATAGGVRRMVVGGAMRMVLGGLVVGLTGSLLLTRAMRGMLYGVRPTDPAAIVGAVVMLAGAGLLASWIPARSGTRVDPIVTMRAE